ncbi:MAG: hypothetical protein HZC23_14600 [Rhodocyclales bacterium]|nr:hypothetical protein [Rhodocyclales bacterium]
MIAPFAYHRYVFVIAIAALAASFGLLFKAGCVGDLKTGSLGDPVAALYYEGLALPPFLLGLLGFAALFFIRRQLAFQYRVAHALAFIFFGGFALWLIGIQFETWGVQQCF